MLRLCYQILSSFSLTFFSSFAQALEALIVLNLALVGPNRSKSLEDLYLFWCLVSSLQAWSKIFHFCEIYLFFICIDASCKGFCKGDLIVNGYLLLLMSSLLQIYKGFCRSIWVTHLLLVFCRFFSHFLQIRGFEGGPPRLSTRSIFINHKYDILQGFWWLEMHFAAL